VPANRCSRRNRFVSSRAALKPPKPPPRTTIRLAITADATSGVAAETSAVVDALEATIRRRPSDVLRRL